MRITPWMAVDRLGFTPSKVRSVRTSWRITHATIGPTIPPRPPARLTPPSTIAATLWSVYGPGTGDPEPVAAVSASPPNAQNSPPIA